MYLARFTEGNAVWTDRGALRKTEKGWVLDYSSPEGDGDRVFPLRGRDVEVYVRGIEEPIIITRGMEIVRNFERVVGYVAGIAPAESAPPATQEPPDADFSVDRSRFPVILGWEPYSNWRYDGNPSTGEVAAIPVRETCASSRHGDRNYFRSSIFGWRRGRLVLTPAGVDFLILTS